MFAIEFYHPMRLSIRRSNKLKPLSQSITENLWQCVDVSQDDVEGKWEHFHVGLDLMNLWVHTHITNLTRCYNKKLQIHWNHLHKCQWFPSPPTPNQFDWFIIYTFTYGPSGMEKSKSSQLLGNTKDCKRWRSIDCQHYQL